MEPTPLSKLPPPPQHFEQLFRASDDPWAMRARWYEQRKRDLTLACLPARAYRSGFEPGCANGELSAALAPRCAQLLAADFSAAAVAAARRRLQEFPHVQVAQLRMPDQWPQQRFDLIVISEWAYYLNAAQLAQLVEAALASLTPHGALLACHWRRMDPGTQQPPEPPPDQEPQPGDCQAAGSVATAAPARPSGPQAAQAVDAWHVHAAFDAAPQLHRLAHHLEDDFMLDVWSRDARSVAQREGWLSAAPSPIRR
jgi:SAM-dependent methyltransferase